NQNTFAWFPASCPDPQFRDPPRAVELARRAVARVPKHADYLNTLGAACYRAGRAEEAVRALEAAIRCRAGGGDAGAFCFLAMGRWQVGTRDEARRAYDDALRWLERFPGARGTELDRVRVEAERLLGRSAR